MKIVARSMIAIFGLATLSAVAFAPLGGADAASANKTATEQATTNTVVDGKKVIKGTKGVGGTVGTTGGAVALTTSDCKLLLGGTVVNVFDGRCGSSGAYCKSPSGSACISEK